MALIPSTDTTISRIFTAYEKRENGRPRAHLGASMIGRECERELWYAFRWALFPSYEGRVLRLFNRGKREEDIFVHDLRAAGVTVHDVDPETGKQFVFSDFGSTTLTRRRASSSSSPISAVTAAAAWTARRSA